MDKWEAPDNPNYLAFLLYGLHNAIPARRFELPSNAEDPKKHHLLKRGGPLLDSLAQLLVFDREGQDVAVAFAQAGDNMPPAFLVAQNEQEVPPRTIRHLRFLSAHLFRIYELLQLQSTQRFQSTQQSQPTHSPPDPFRAQLKPEGNDELAQLCAEGETAAFFQSWKKMEWRFFKNRRNTSFINLVKAVFNELPAAERIAFDENVHPSLEALRNLDVTVHECLRELNESIESISALLKKMKKMSSGAVVPSTEEQLVLLQLRGHCHVIRRHLERPSNLWTQCDEYLEARFPHSSIPPKLAPGKQAPARAFKVAKWLGKVIFISVEYSQIIRAAHSPTISNALFGFNHSPPRVIPVTHTGKEEREVTVSKSALKHIIDVALQDDVTQRQKDVPQSEDEEDGFISNIINRFKKLAFTSVEGDQDSYSGKWDPFVHCECAILAYAGDNGFKLFDYVGVSRLSCALCSMYFQCYRTVTGIQIYTRGTHDQLVKWKAPELSNDPQFMRGELRALLTERFKAEVKQKRADYDRRKDPQSSVGSLVLLEDDGVRSKDVSHDSVATQAKMQRNRRAIPFNVDEFNEVVMIVGDGNIVPMYPILKSALDDPTNKCDFALIFAKEHRDVYSMEKELEELETTHTDRLTVYYTFYEDIQARLVHLPDPKHEKVKVVVCVPPEKEEAIAGSLSDSWYGEFGGILKDHGYTSEQVHVF